jgi:2-polyprenyl-3-methyl-5-hydroxy-6-metoxy-1,4-benzoquinol methylase
MPGEPVELHPGVGFMTRLRVQVEPGRSAAAVRRNEPCPCGSGRRYKHCCGTAPEADTLPELKAAALRYHQSGALTEAERCYRQALRKVADEPDCLHMLGAVCYQTGRLHEAAQLIGRALALTGWRIAAMRENLSLVFSHLLQQPGFVSGLIAEAENAPGGDPAKQLCRPFADPIVIRPALVRGSARDDASADASSAPALTFTGERFTPEEAGQIWYEHWHRYLAVEPFARGLRVLDAASGEGYGSHWLAGSARDVVGIDLSWEAVAHASRRYADEKLQFAQAAVDRLPFPDASFDVVVSFETIEHLERQTEMLAEFRRVLGPDGVLFISSPNKSLYSDANHYVNEFHVRELTRDQFAAMLERDFPQQRWYAQRMLAHSLMWAERFAPISRGGASSTAGARLSWSLPAEPMYFVVVCGGREAALPDLPGVSALVHRGGEPVFVSLAGLLGLRAAGEDVAGEDRQRNA